MKNLLLAAYFSILSCGISFAVSENSESTGEPDAICAGTIYTNGVSTDAICVDAQGTISPVRNLTNSIGSSRVRYKDIFTAALHTSSGNVKSAYYAQVSSLALTGAGGNSTGIGFTVSTRTLEEAPTTYISALDIDPSSGGARNLTLYVASDTVSSGIGVFSTTTLILSCTAYGYDNKGNFVSEQIYASTNSVMALSSSTISVPNIRRVDVVGIGNVAWLHITSITIEVSSMTASYGAGNTRNPILVIGYGYKFGLPGDIDSVADVLRVEEGGLDRTDQTLYPKLSINPTWDTIGFNAGLEYKNVFVNSRHSN